MAGKAIEAGKAFLTLFVNDAAFKSGLNASILQLDAFGKAAVSVGTKIAGVGAAMSAPFIASIKIFADMGSELHDMSQRTGIAASELSKLKYAAEQSGTSLNTIVKAARNMQKAGLDPTTFIEVATAVGKIEDPVKRAQASMEKFGSRQGQDLLPMIANLDELIARCDELNLTLSDESVKAAEALGDAFGDVGKQGKALAFAIGEALEPHVSALVEALTAGNAKLIEWIRNNEALVTLAATVSVAIAGIGTATVALGLAMRATAISVTALRAAMTLLAKHPWAILITVALGLLAAALGPLIDKWLGFDEAVETSTDKTEKNAASQKKLTGALKEGTKAVDERTEAFNKLFAGEQALSAAADKRARDERTAATYADLRNKAAIEAIDQQIDAAQQMADLQRQRAAEIRQSSGAEAAGAPAAEARRHQAEADSLRRDRAELTGEAAKKREELAKEAATKREEAIKEQERMREEAQQEFDKWVSDAISLKENVLGQLESADRGFRGGAGGKFAEQIAGSSAAQSTERRMLQLNEKSTATLEDIKALLQGAGVMMVSNS